MAVDLERMIHPDDARATIFRYLWRLPVESVPLRDASWRVLSGDLLATEDQPPFPAATMDGYAVVADDPSPWREIVGRQSAGYIADLEVGIGTAAWITTGAPVPAGATAVVPVEATELADDHVIVHQEYVAPRCCSVGVSSEPRRWGSWPAWESIRWTWCGVPG